MKIAKIAFTAALTLALVGCGGSETAYRDDIATDDIATAVDAVISAENLIAMDEAYLDNAMQVDPSHFDDFTVKINSTGINIDEYGIFHAADDEAAEAIEAYLDMRVENWMVEYMPEEFPKLESAEVVTYGEYVMYAILSDDNRTAAFAELEAELAN